MFRFRLRTLLIVLALAPPVLAGGWYVSRIILDRLAREESLQLNDLA